MELFWDIILVIACVVLVLGAWFAGDRFGNWRAVLFPSVLLIALLAALPVFSVPFSYDAQILRVAFAARDVNADWNHPFLSYLLNRPAALMSLDPVVLRLAPFCWFLIETLLFAVIAERLAGRLAGALTVVWMALSVRISMGMIDLSDWNLAGIFLALMLLWVERGRTNGGWRRWIPVPALLILGGCFSSHMMVVPSTILVVHVLTRKSGSGRNAVDSVTSVLAMAVVLYFFLDVVSIGRMAPKLGFATNLPAVLIQMFLEAPPLGLSPLIPALAIGGLLFMPWRGQRAQWSFLATVLAVSFFAVLAGLFLAAINGGYYFGLMKGPVYVAAAAGASLCVDAAAGKTGVAGLHVRAVSSLAVIALLALATFRVEPFEAVGTVPGIEHMKQFVQLSGSGERRVVSNDQNASILMEFEEIREGRMDIGSILDSRRSNWVTGTVSVAGVDGVDCRSLPGSYLFLWRRSGNSIPDCDPVAVRDCRELFVPVDGRECRESGRTFCYYDCRRIQAD